MRNQSLRHRYGHDQNGGDGITLVPYLNQSIPDALIIDAWDLMEGEGTAKTTFPLGVVTNGVELVQYLNLPFNLPVIMMTDKVIGIAWVNQIEHSSAYAHFWASKSLWGAGAINAAARVMRYWFSWGDDDPVIKVLMGRIPASNVRAIRFSERIGCKTFGPIPHSYFGLDAVYTYITKDMINGPI